MIGREVLDKNKLNSITCMAGGIGDDVWLKVGGIDTGCGIFHTDILKDELWDDPASDLYGKTGMDGRFYTKLGKRYGHIHHKVTDKFIHNALSPSL